MAWNIIQSGLSAIYMGLRTQTGDWLTFSVAQIPPADIAQGYVIYLFGNLMFHTGLVFLHPDRRPRSVTVSCDPVICLRWTILLWAVGLGYYAKQALFESFGTPVKILFWAPLAAVSLIALTPRDRLRMSMTTWWAFFLVGTAGLLAVNILTGSKAYIMFSFLPLVWVAALSPRTRVLLSPLFLVLATIYFFFVAPTINTAREMPQRSGETATQHIVNSFNPSSLFNNAPTPVQFASDQIELYLLRQFECTPTGYIVGEVRKNGFVWGDTMTHVAYAFIPRIVWPDKPAVQRGAWFSAYLGAAPRESEATTSTGMSAAGELYWNFGNVGVAVGMFGLGALWAFLWRLAGANPINQPLHMLLYVNALFGMTALPEAISSYVTAISLIVIFVPLFFFLERPGGRG
jgi:hypothetical protein